MILKQNVDLGAAFDLLKKALKSAKETWEIDSIPKMVYAHAILTGTLEGVLNCVEEKESEPEIEDDIPPTLFTQTIQVNNDTFITTKTD